MPGRRRPRCSGIARADDARTADIDGRPGNGQDDPAGGGGQRVFGSGVPSAFLSAGIRSERARLLSRGRLSALGPRSPAVGSRRPAHGARLRRPGPQGRVRRGRRARDLHRPRQVVRPVVRDAARDALGTRLGDRVSGLEPREEGAVVRQMPSRRGQADPEVVGVEATEMYQQGGTHATRIVAQVPPCVNTPTAVVHPAARTGGRWPEGSWYLFHSGSSRLREDRPGTAG